MNTIKDDRGFTLVELLTTFVLLSIFMVAATQVISSTINVYFRTKSEAYGRQVSQIISEKVTSQIAGCEYAAEATPTIYDPTAAPGTSNSIDLYDRTGTKVNISRNGYNKLNIKYYAVTTGEEDNKFNETNWTFGDNAYMGFDITELRFSWANGATTETPPKDADAPSSSYGPNVIRIDMTIHSERYGDYSTVQYVEMYNYEKSVP